jgi:hypothetical protein
VSNAKNNTKYRGAPVLSRTRRRLFFSLLMVAAIPAIIPVVSAALAAPAGISPRMSDLITEFDRCTADLRAVDYGADPLAWQAAADARCDALQRLLDHRPGSLTDLRAKAEALTAFVYERDELIALHVLAADIRDLAEGRQ